MMTIPQTQVIEVSKEAAELLQELLAKSAMPLAAAKHLIPIAEQLDGALKVFRGA